jgi:hypothetical protein
VLADLRAFANHLIQRVASLHPGAEQRPDLDVVGRQLVSGRHAVVLFETPVRCGLAHVAMLLDGAL